MIPCALPATATAGSAPMLTPVLRRLTWCLRGGALLLAVTLALLPAGFWLTPEQMVEASTALVGAALPRVTMDARAAVLGALATLPSVLVGLWMLWRLWQLLGEYLAERVFSPLALLAWRGFARSLALLALLMPLQRTALALALTLGNPPGQRQLLISISSQEFMALLLAGLLWLVATVMATAGRLAEENQGFV